MVFRYVFLFHSQTLWSVTFMGLAFLQTLKALELSTVGFVFLKCRIPQQHPNLSKILEKPACCCDTCTLPGCRKQADYKLQGQPGFLNDTASRKPRSSDTFSVSSLKLCSCWLLCLTLGYISAVHLGGGRPCACKHLPYIIFS